MPPSGDDEGIAFANRLRETHPEIGVVVVSQYADPRYGLALLEGGSDRRAYLLKDRLRDREHLIAAVYDGRRRRLGGRRQGRRSADRARRSGPSDSPLAELTPRELEILARDGPGQEQPGDRRGARS